MKQMFNKLQFIFNSQSRTEEKRREGNGNILIYYLINFR